MSKLSHIDSNNQPTMVDVSGKIPTEREAHARAVVIFPEAVASRISGGDIESSKGPVFATEAFFVGREIERMVIRKSAPEAPMNLRQTTANQLPANSCCRSGSG